MAVQYSSLSSAIQKDNPSCSVCHHYFQEKDRVIKLIEEATMAPFVHMMCLDRFARALIMQKTLSPTSRFVALNRTLDSPDRIEDFKLRKLSESDPEVQELKKELDQLQKELAEKSKSVFSGLFDSCIIS